LVILKKFDANVNISNDRTKENGLFIGPSATIVPDLVIGENPIVAAGLVVTKKIILMV
jgi:acetyltransferase-like isoleucine patch superfamily enzyme